MSYCQVSCFLPGDGKISVSDIDSFRSKMVNKLSDNSVDISSGKPFIDCWSCDTSAKVYGAFSGTAYIVACGGDFFSFHPLKLVSGNYFSGDDLNRDNILLDEDLAWLLFGGNDIEGQTVYIYNTPFRVAGVVTRENDQASEKAYKGGLGLFMNYDTLVDLSATAYGESSGSSSSASAVTTTTDGLLPPKSVGITCYEVCMPDPVKNFAKGVVESEFPIGNGDIVVNTGRFDILNLVQIMKDFSLRSIHDGAAYSYWENAARYAENKAAIFILIGALVALLPEVFILVNLFRDMTSFNRRIRETVLPAATENISEAVRKRQRRRWEKLHPDSRD